MDKNEIKSVWAAFLEVQEAKHKKTEKLDPVGKEDDDVDNDGDTDSSDEYLKNRRKKIGKAMKEGEESPYPSLDKKKREKKGSNLEDAGGPAAKLKGESVEESSEESPYPSLDKKKREKKGSNLEDAGGPAAKLKGESVEVDEGAKDRKDPKDPHGHKKAAQKPLNLNPNKTTKVKTYESKEECPKCKGEGCDHCDGKGYHEMEKETYGKKKMKESNLFSEAELATLEEKMKQPNDTGTPAEPFMSTNSAGEKKFYADHEKGSEKKYEDWEETSENDGVKAGKAVKSQSPARRGDNLKVGDNKMETPKKG